MSSRGALMVAVVCGALAACGPPSHPNNPAETPASLNSLSAAQVVTDLTDAGLPALNSHDVTDSKCPRMRCTQAVDTDTVSVFKFPATGIAQQYAGSTSNVYQVEDIVLAFAPSVTPKLKQDYESVVNKALK